MGFNSGFKGLIRAICWWLYCDEWRVTAKYAA